MSRIERLLNLTSALLHTRRPLAAEELQATIPDYPEDRDSFRRQFERDKDALRRLGLPLVVEPLPMADNENQVGYRIVGDDYFLRDPGLAPDELSALHLAGQLVRMGEGGEAVQSLWKLGATPPVPAGEMLPATVADLPSSSILPTLFEALALHAELSFTYKGESRGVVPRRLSFRNGHWYLVAFDRARNDDRSFRVDRIDVPVEVGGVHSSPLPDTAAASTRAYDAPWELGAAAAVPATIRIEGPQALWAAQRLGPDAVVDSSPDSITFRLSVRNREALRSFVLGFLDHAVLLDPPELADDLCEWVRQGAGT